MRKEEDDKNYTLSVIRQGVFYAFLTVLLLSRQGEMIQKTERFAYVNADTGVTAARIQRNKPIREGRHHGKPFRSCNDLF
ncbi:hypothetical protein [Bacillus siamensis]|uniref:hypothetical protein n=1 Tax=Bacillus siamensis TaxID=659243 RepID=UPI002E24BE62|nr:hypothetical protein [Bacillus siamensis]MED0775513.1 hypothetical protein [Bacillus siamensis]MED0778753.1 hypothetical protein [Bacillus siamensis]MED0835610.1 hypothetical protein [Bacillus siamensis]